MRVYVLFCWSLYYYFTIVCINGLLVSVVFVVTIQVAPLHLFYWE
jgi:hypothetical protein